MENSSKPKLLHRFAGGARQNLGVFDQFVHADGLDIFQASASARSSDDVGGPGGFAIHRIFLFFQIEIIARRFRSIGHRPGFGLIAEEGQAGRNHKRFLRTADDDVKPQPSISSGMVPMPVMASTTKRALVFLTAKPIAYVMLGAGGGFRKPEQRHP